MSDLDRTGNFIFYRGREGEIKVRVILGDETIWVTEKGLAEVFGTSRQNVNYHLKNIFDEGELDKESVCKEILHTADDNKKYNTRYFNLDCVISVGYRISSAKATKFRKWATSILKGYMVRGYALDDERLKQGENMFGKDYFSELLERIREIRASERRFYQKITDIYAQCSIDYDPHSSISQEFYATVQNKLHWAIHHHTAAELIIERANSDMPNMGLTTWKNQKDGGKILKSDVAIAKNYLNSEEIGELNRVVSMYLDFAENMARRNRAMKMVDWIERLDAFLNFNEYDILKNAGSVSKQAAKKVAESQYKKFRVIQDRDFVSDFDKVVHQIQESDELPNEEEEQLSLIEELRRAVEGGKFRDSPLSDFNQKLKTALNTPPPKDWENDNND